MTKEMSIQEMMELPDQQAQPPYPPTYYCNKCYYLGPTAEHRQPTNQDEVCKYTAVDLNAPAQVVETSKAAS
jgi:hypothetical protein